MEVLNNLEPKSVFYFFEQITKIPHGSRNEKKISDFLVNFAKERNLDVYQDKALNVIIKKPGTKGYENAPTVIIQGHMDMVCEKLKDVEHDFENDPLKLRIKDDYIYATGTTLGGDDGIAIAYGLAILDSKDIDHPPIEFVATSNEEDGMDGAFALDTKNLKGKMLINIDGEEDGVFIVSCAGGITATTKIKTELEKCEKDAITIKVAGLSGGHSGMEIVKERGNANKLMGRILYTLSKNIDFNIAHIEGGTKENAIPRECSTVITLDREEIEKVKEVLNKVQEDLKAEYSVQDPSVEIKIENSNKVDKHLSKRNTQSIVRFLTAVPDGIHTMSQDIKGLVESSLNVAIINTKEDEIEIISSIRSSVYSRKFEIADKIEALAEAVGATFERESEYPGWQYDKDSKIRDISVSVYKKLFGEEPIITAIHAGLECGLFKETMKDTDMISFGPDIIDVHTANEHLKISSVEKYWRLLKEILKNIK
ncbi:aminoacyl-histidine dipeptidase [Clostridium tepidum]|uniref:Cytosol non-specific dipeptidase n=1 Tax=Clostridium tepidum TaxID=1962263 RepID=A0A1S9I183_9CLOT|nr:aminoacyl-histidine dipeptidase [Clostridium tepidum]MCR1933158.1 aminoacyl-histidine dipeptidase [Clostridium tepidum]MDU6877320.1 aminoacyl-histidine dipeptidase [Clostridium botulinum]OOO62785.1 aminoacyl-histidine dipeptidase [Clostridium tepidum]OOO64101.1 aminoacyl-histidine dipeptidase [Clostridium tepidum]